MFEFLTVMAQTILVDGNSLSRPWAGTGIHRYTVSLLREFAQIATGESAPHFRIFVPSLTGCELDGWSRQSGFDVTVRPWMRFYRAWKYGLANSLAVGAQGVLFEPAPVSIYVKPKRLAVTVHDVIPLLFPERYRSPIFRHTYTSSLRKADLILTDSECSKADMVSRFGVPAHKVVVAYLGYERDAFRPGPADTPEGREMRRRIGINRPYILHVGGGDPRKNLVRLVRAYEATITRRKDLDFQLVLGGSPGWGSEPLLQLVRKPSLRGNVILAGRVADCDLPQLYRGAACFAMPSLYEGFGLPALEAMACGTPMMISNGSSLPEVGGEAALYFDPESVDEMAQAMERVLTDSALREEMSRKGLERAQQFSWGACARTTLAALQSL
jgi:glycosyltransferase involved in cell wall biosynthesis